MAEDELEYDDLYFDDGDNYFYIDDGYALADELAETSVPEPGINDYVDDWDDLTRFEYFNDVEYDSDGFNDVSTRTRSKSQTKTSSTTAESKGTKRKWGGAAAEANPSKRRKVPTRSNAQATTMPSIVFLSNSSELVTSEPTVDVSKLDTYSVLPNWREQFKNIKGVASVFAEAVNAEKQASMEDEETVEDAADGNGEDEADLPDAMKALSLSLERKLSDMGLDVALIDQSKLLLLAQKMMAGDDDTEDLLAEIIEGIHGVEKEGDDERDPFSQWVAGNTGKEPNENGAEDGDEESKTSERDDSLIDQTTLPDSTGRSLRSNGTSSGRKRKMGDSEITPEKRKQPKRKA